MVLRKSLRHSLTGNIDKQVNIDRKKTKRRITWVGEPGNGDLAPLGTHGIGQRHRP